MHITKPLRFHCVSLLLVLLALGHQSVSAQYGTLLSNLANTTTGTFTFGHYTYQSFLVGSSDATIQAFWIEFGRVDPGPGIDSGRVLLSLLSDNASAPGSSLANFSYGGSPFALSNDTVPFNGNFNVMANTRYWIKLTAAGWFFDSEVRTTSDSSETGFAGWSIGDSSYSFYASEVPESAWEVRPSIKMEIYGTAVPEPSTYALFGLGALALVVAYRRKVA